MGKINWIYLSDKIGLAVVMVAIFLLVPSWFSDNERYKSVLMALIMLMLSVECLFLRYAIKGQSND